MAPSELGRIGGVEGDRRMGMEFQKLAQSGDGVENQCPWGVGEARERVVAWR